MKVMSLCQEKPFPLHIPLGHTPYLFWSGGLDSTVLLYYLRKFGVEPKIIFIESNCPYVSAVDNILTRIHKVNIDIRIGIEDNEPSKESVFMYYSRKVIKGSRDVFYTATTDVYKELEGHYTRYHSRSYPSNNFMFSEKVYSPFSNYKKDVVIEAAHEIGFNLESTYTCLRSIIPCKTCYACKEKELAIDIFNRRRRHD